MRHVVLLMVAILMWVPEVLAQFVGPGGTVPAVANLPGRNGTLWRSDVNVLNINQTDTSVVLLLLPEISRGEAAFEPRVTDPIQIPAGTQLTLSNVLQTQFDLTNTKGGLTIFSLDGAPVVISSRTYTVAEGGGSFGQEVAGQLVASTGWVSGLRHDSLFRTNVGVFLPVEPEPDTAAVFAVTVYRADGTEAASGSILFESAGLQQKSLDAFGVDGLLDGYAEITCSDPSFAWYGYASIVDQLTGDPVYRAVVGRRTDLP
jgi:hypothetical protein